MDKYNITIEEKLQSMPVVYFIIKSNGKIPNPYFINWALSLARIGAN